MNARTIFSLAIFTAILFFFCQKISAEMRPVLKNRVGVPPFDVLKEILATGSQPRKDAGPVGSGAAAPWITWLADADARVQPERIFARPGGRIFSVRNLANQLDSNAGAVDFGVLYLRSPVLLITGNTDSEAIRLFRQGLADLTPSLRQELDRLMQPLGAPGQAGKGEDGETQRLLVEKNIDYQVRQAVERYRERINRGRLVVVGSVLDIANLYGRGAEQLLIININGETDPEKLRALPLLRTVDPKLLTRVGRSAAPDSRGTTRRDTF
jgi:carbonic anhydrase